MSDPGDSNAAPQHAFKLEPMNSHANNNNTSNIINNNNTILAVSTNHVSSISSGNSNAGNNVGSSTALGVAADLQPQHAPQHHHLPEASVGIGSARPESEEDDEEEDDDGSGRGRVVESGKEHTGRWTKEEHEAFLDALEMYGKEWKKVAAKVKTRTVVQTRTHAQKYFQKLQKTDEHHPDTGSEGKPKKKRVSKTPTRRNNSIATISAAHVISTMNNNTLAANTEDEPAGGQQQQQQHTNDIVAPALRHGFSTFNEWRQKGGGMKINLPDPALTATQYPEPSPAATGKRKLAEIAAAHMLAGVAASSSTSKQVNREDAPTPPPHPTPAPPFLNKNDATSTTPPRKGLTLQIVNPESLGVTNASKRSRGDSPVTPWDGQLEAALSNERAKKNDNDADVNNLLDAEDVSVPNSPTTSTHSTTSITNSSGINKTLAQHPVCYPSTGYGRKGLHQAVCEGHLDNVRQELLHVANQSAEILRRLDQAGYCPLHSACSLLLKNLNTVTANPAAAGRISSEMVRILLSAGADASQEDAKGNTALHWAACAGDATIVGLLVNRNCNLDAKNSSGETPLHWAMRAGPRSVNVVATLLENGARTNILDKTFKRAIDVAGEGFLDDEGSIAALKQKEGYQLGKKAGKTLQKLLKGSLKDRRDMRTNFLLRSPPSRTLVLHHPECLEHHPKSSADWECPDRISSIIRRIIPNNDPTGATESSGVFSYEVTVSQDFERATLELLGRVHSTNYLAFVDSLSKDLERQQRTDDSDSGSGAFPPPAVPFTPLVQRSMVKVAESRVKLGANSDTSFSAGSLKAARRAAGAVQHAVDCVLLGRNRNAFCIVRPPGHHAGINGLLDGGESCGFCIFNNVAAGALYAISDERKLCNRCAIVDIDVHHGNGTEEIVRKCHDPSKLFFFSIHLYDNDKKKRNPNQFAYKFYPGTGADDDLALNIINVPLVPLWKDSASSYSGQGSQTRAHNTRQKARTNTSENPSSNEGNDNTPPDSDTPRSSTKGSDLGSDEGMAPPSATTSPRVIPSGGTLSGRAAYRHAIQHRLLPSLRAFNPDLILISTGLDAAKGDVGNARHERGRERLGLDLEPEDYAWTTRQICQVADVCGHGRVVSVLEGGYGRTPVIPKENQGLDKSVFSECAIRHLQALIDPYNTESRFPN